MLKKYLNFILFLLSIITSAQQQTIISGTVIDAKTQSALKNIVVAIQNSNITELTKSDGSFELHSTINGEQLLLVHGQGYKDLLLKINSNFGQKVNLGILQLDEDFSDEIPAALITLSESDFSDDNSSSEITSGLLQSSKDAFLQAAAFNWGQARFRVRGLDSEKCYYDA